MFYYRTNRDQLGDRNDAVPRSAYQEFTITIPNGPGGGPGTTNLQPVTATVWNIPSSLASADQTIRTNQPELDTEYKGVEFTATKRFSSRWQMQAGFTVGKNEGGFGGDDLNDPNRTRFPRGIVGNDSERAFRLSGSYELPLQIALAGSLVANTGYPFVSTYSLTRAVAASQGVTLTRATQSISLSERARRLPNVNCSTCSSRRSARRRSSADHDVLLTNSDTRDTKLGGGCELPFPTSSAPVSPASVAWNF